MEKCNVETQPGATERWTDLTSPNPGTLIDVVPNAKHVMNAPKINKKFGIDYQWFSPCLTLAFKFTGLFSLSLISFAAK